MIVALNYFPHEEVSIISTKQRYKLQQQTMLLQVVQKVLVQLAVQYFHFCTRITNIP